MRSPLLIIGLLVSGPCLVLGIPAQQEAAKEESPPKITYSKKTVAKPGTDIDIDCAVEGIDLSGVPDFSISWSKIDVDQPVNSIPISSGDKVLIFGTKYSILHPDNTYQYSLKIHKTHEKDSGLYRCTVNFGSNQKINADVPLLVEVPAYFVDDLTKELTVTEGDSISIDCQPGGSPEPEVYWEKVDSELPHYGGRFFKANKLDLPNIGLEHNGHYVCYADNGLASPARSEVILNVQFAPRIETANEVVATSISDSATLACTATAYPRPDLTWVKDGEPLFGSANYKIETKYDAEKKKIYSTVEILDVNYEDLGEYKCKATNPVGSTFGAVELLLKQPPLITEQTEGRRYFEPQQLHRGRQALPIELECKAKGYPEPTYRWTKNGESVSWGKDQRVSIDEKTGTLLISDPTFDDNGVYQCFAHNEMGTAFSKPITLLNQTQFEFQHKSEQEGDVQLTAVVGHPFQMKCPDVTGDPMPILRWVKTYPEEGDQMRLQFMGDERTVVDPDGTLWFAHVEYDDDTIQNGYTYMCVASLEDKPEDLSLGKKVSLKVEAPPSGEDIVKLPGVNIETFEMFTSPKEVVFRTDDPSNKLWCIFGGEPVPNVYWQRVDGRELAKERLRIDNNGRTLVFFETQVSDAGAYECLADNGVGSEKRQVMSVTVHSVPELKKQMESMDLSEGSDATFSCSVKESNDVNFEWFFNSRPMKIGPGSGRDIVDDKLVVRKASLADVGNYACKASNEHGSAYGQATLNVIPDRRQSQRYEPCVQLNVMEDQLEGLRQEVGMLSKANEQMKNSDVEMMRLLRMIANKVLGPDYEKVSVDATVEHSGKQHADHSDITIAEDVAKESDEPQPEPEPLLDQPDVLADSPKSKDETVAEGETAEEKQADPAPQPEETPLEEPPQRAPKPDEAKVEDEPKAEVPSVDDPVAVDVKPPEDAKPVEHDSPSDQATVAEAEPNQPEGDTPKVAADPPSDAADKPVEGSIQEEKAETS